MAHQDLNEMVSLKGGLTVRRSVLEALKHLEANSLALGLPFLSKAVTGLGGMNEAAVWMDMPDQYGISPAEYIVLHHNQVDATHLLDNYLTTGKQELPKLPNPYK